MSIKIALQQPFTADDNPHIDQLTRWVNAVLQTIPDKISNTQNEVTIRIVDNEESAELNEHYREKKGPTNVLSFPDDPIVGFESDSLGDIILCAPLIKKEAAEQGKTLESHWAHLIIHGVLHVLGYDHIEEEDATVMEGLEVKVMQQLDYPNPYQ